MNVNDATCIGFVYAANSRCGNGKRSASPSMTQGPKSKQIKIAPKLDLSGLTEQQKLWLSHTANIDTFELQTPLSFCGSVDSGIASLSENSCQEFANSSSLADVSNAWTLPNLHRVTAKPKNKRKRKSPHNSLIQSSPDGGGHLVKKDEGGINDILANIEKELSSPARKLLNTPPKQHLATTASSKENVPTTPTTGLQQNNLFTSTPFKQNLDSPSWISPIRGFFLTDDGDFNPSIFTPSDAHILHKKTSTPLDGQVAPAALRTPPIGEESDVFRGISTVVSPDKSPKLRALRNLTLTGLTPLKSPNKKGNGGSPGGLPVEEGSSFGKLLGDLHLDSIIDEGISDMANMSFSHLAL